MSRVKGEGEIVMRFVIQEKVACCLACMLVCQVRGNFFTPDLHVHELL